MFPGYSDTLVTMILPGNLKWDEKPQTAYSRTMGWQWVIRDWCWLWLKIEFKLPQVDPQKAKGKVKKTLESEHVLPFKLHQSDVNGLKVHS